MSFNKLSHEDKIVKMQPLITIVTNARSFELPPISFQILEAVLLFRT
jgi:hypothetical protein